MNEIEKAAREYVDSFDCIDTYAGINRKSMGDISMDAFKAGYDFALSMASEGFKEHWLKNFDLINGTMHSSRELWQAAKLSCAKELAEKDERIKHLESIVSDMYLAVDVSDFSTITIYKRMVELFNKAEIPV